MQHPPFLLISIHHSPGLREHVQFIPVAKLLIYRCPAPKNDRRKSGACELNGIYLIYANPMATTFVSAFGMAFTLIMPKKRSRCYYHIILYTGCLAFNFASSSGIDLSSLGLIKGWQSGSGKRACHLLTQLLKYLSQTSVPHHEWVAPHSVSAALSCYALCLISILFFFFIQSFWSSVHFLRFKYYDSTSRNTQCSIARFHTIIPTIAPHWPWPVNQKLF